MGAPKKKGLEFFSVDVHIFDTRNDLFDLMGEFGYGAFTIVMAVWTIVYQHGSFARMSRDTLIGMVMRIVACGASGRDWDRTKSTVERVIGRMADIGLIDKECLKSGIVTSVEMQRVVNGAYGRMRRCSDEEDFWLLDPPEKSRPGTASEKSGGIGDVLSAPKNRVNSERTPVNAEETLINTEETPLKRKEKEKEKDIDAHTRAAALAPPLFSDKDTNDAFLLWLKKREEAGAIRSMDDVFIAAAQLRGLSDDPDDVRQSAQAAALGGWKTFVLRRKKKQRKAAGQDDRKRNFVGSFGRYDQRDFDYRGVEKKIRYDREAAGADKR